MPAKNDPPRTCNYCSEPHVALDCCRGHYQRLRTTGDVHADVPLRKMKAPGTNPQCYLSVCDRDARALGLCQPHYYRLLHHGDVQADIPIRTWRCSIPGCQRPHSAHGMCREDLDHFNATGDVLPVIPCQQ